MKAKDTKENNKALYLFGIIFTFLMLFTMLVESFTLKWGWLRPLNNAWSDFRINSPRHAATFFSSKSSEESYAFSFGRLFNKSGDPRIIIAAVDNHTLNNLGYPFKRKYYGQLIERLNKLGAKAIVMDIFTVDPDKADPESDASYIRAVKKAGNVISLMDLDRWNSKFQLPIKGLGFASRYLAIPNMDRSIGSDNFVRSLYIFEPDFSYGDIKGLETSCAKTECGGIQLPGLAATAYAVYSNMPLSAVWARYGENYFRINFRYPQTRVIHAGWSKEGSTSFSVYKQISILDIIQGKISDDERLAIKGSIAFVGSTAIGAFDHYPSPFMPNLPGVDIHANALDNMLHGDFLRPVSSWLVVFLVLAGIWLPIGLRKQSVALLTAATAAFCGTMLVFDYYLVCKLYNFVLASVIVAAAVSFVVASVQKALMAGREKKWIKNTFGQYLSPKVVELITKDPSKLSLGGEKRDMTAFFLDIAGFTTISEKLTPDQLTKMMNTYLSGFTDVILRHDGVVDKYIGDCIMAFWNAPLDQKDHRKLACLAAIDCLSELRSLNEVSEFSIKPDCRIGLNSGFMVVGNMGSKTRMSYTVMGDTVNLASRLEGANKFFHSKIMVSEYTYDEAKDFIEARMLGQIRVVGKAIPVKVYEPLAHKGKLPADVSRMRDAYNEGYAEFFKGSFGKARKAFEAALAVMPADGPSKFYLDLAIKYAEGTPKDWDGTFNLTSK